MDYDIARYWLDISDKKQQLLANKLNTFHRKRCIMTIGVTNYQRISFANETQLRS